MSPHLPPALLLAALLAGVAWRTAARPSEPLSEDRIRGHVESEDPDRLLPALDRYLARFDAPHNRWFAAGVLLRLKEYARALEAVFGVEALAADPDTPQRFAREALYAIGWEDERRAVPTPFMPRCLVILAEGGDPWAVRALERVAGESELHAATLVYFPAFREAGRAPMRVIERAFRARGQEAFLVAAALGALDHHEYPEREADIDRLIEVLGLERWRVHNRDVWGVAAFALGRSTAPRAIEALLEARRRVPDPASEDGALEHAILTNGLLAAGRMDEREVVERLVFRERPAPLLTSWYVDALLACFIRDGDEAARRSLRRVWEEQGPLMVEQRWRIARGLLLQEHRPDPAAPWLPVMLADLEAPGAPLLSQALGAAWRLRKGEPGARERLVALLHEAARGAQGEAAGVDERLAGARPFLEALRALWLYGAPGDGQR